MLAVWVLCALMVPRATAAPPHHQAAHPNAQPGGGGGTGGGGGGGGSGGGTPGGPGAGGGTGTSGGGSASGGLGQPAANDFLTNTTGGFSGFGDQSLLNAYPLSNFQLDSFVPLSSTHHVGLFGVNVASVSVPDLSNIPSYLVQGVANFLWQIITWISLGVILLVSWAFAFPLLSSLLSSASGVVNILAGAISGSPNDPLSTGLVAAALSALGLWAIYQALLRQRIVHTVRSLAITVLAVGIATWIMVDPSGSIGKANGYSNDISTAMLGTVADGSAAAGVQKVQGGPAQSQSASRAQGVVANDLFRTLVFDPWVVLEFNGLQHCTNASDSSTTVALTSGGGCSYKINNVSAPGNNSNQFQPGRGGYAYQYLLYPTGSPQRQVEYFALAGGGMDNNQCADAPANSGGGANHPCQDGVALLKASGNAQRQQLSKQIASDTGDKTVPDPDNNMTAQNAAHPVAAITKADEPAVYLQSSALSAGFQRIGMIALLFVGHLGFWLLLGLLAVALLVTQLLALALFLLAPAALLAGIFPGKGHDLFLEWLKKLGGAIFVKAIYALALSIVLAVSEILQTVTLGASAGGFALGWFGTYGLQAILFWALFMKRHAIAAQIQRVSLNGQQVPMSARAAVAGNPFQRRGGEGGASTGTAAGDAIRRKRQDGKDRLRQSARDRFPKAAPLLFRAPGANLSDEEKQQRLHDADYEEMTRSGRGSKREDAPAGSGEGRNGSSEAPPTAGPPPDSGADAPSGGRAPGSGGNGGMPQQPARAGAPDNGGNGVPDGERQLPPYVRGLSRSARERRHGDTLPQQPGQGRRDGREPGPQQGPGRQDDGRQGGGVPGRQDDGRKGGAPARRGGDSTRTPASMGDTPSRGNGSAGVPPAPQPARRDSRTPARDPERGPVPGGGASPGPSRSSTGERPAGSGVGERNAAERPPAAPGSRPPASAPAAPSSSQQAPNTSPGSTPKQGGGGGQQQPASDPAAPDKGKQVRNPPVPPPRRPDRRGGAT